MENKGGIGNKLKKILSQRNMTIAELSELSKVSKNTLYAITKRDSKYVRFDTLEKITDALQIPVSELMETKNIEEYVVDSRAIDYDFSVIKQALQTLNYEITMYERLHTDTKEREYIYSIYNKDSSCFVTKEELKSLQNEFLSFLKFKIQELIYDIEITNDKKGLKTEEKQQNADKESIEISYAAYDGKGVEHKEITKEQLERFKRIEREMEE